MKLAPIVSRLEAETAGFKLLGRIGGLAALEGKSRPALPAGFVVPIRDLARQGAERSVGATRQTIDVIFGVAIVTLNRADQAGGAAADDIDELKDAVTTALVGWSHPEATSVVIYRGGRLLPSPVNQARWLSEFATEERISQ